MCASAMHITINEFFLSSHRISNVRVEAKHVHVSASHHSRAECISPEMAAAPDHFNDGQCTARSVRKNTHIVGDVAPIWGWTAAQQHSSSSSSSLLSG